MLDVTTVSGRFYMVSNFEGAEGNERREWSGRAMEGKGEGEVE